MGYEGSFEDDGGKGRSKFRFLKNELSKDRVNSTNESGGEDNFNRKEM